jgi:hypothetical protein
MSAQTSAATQPRRPVLKRRWPTALALVLSALTFDGGAIPALRLGPIQGCWHRQCL